MVEESCRIQLSYSLKPLLSDIMTCSFVWARDLKPSVARLRIVLVYSM